MTSINLNCLQKRSLTTIKELSIISNRLKHLEHFKYLKHLQIAAPERLKPLKTLETPENLKHSGQPKQNNVHNKSWLCLLLQPYYHKVHFTYPYDCHISLQLKINPKQLDSNLDSNPSLLSPHSWNSLQLTRRSVLGLNLPISKSSEADRSPTPEMKKDNH